MMTALPFSWFTIGAAVAGAIGALGIILTTVSVQVHRITLASRVASTIQRPTQRSFIIIVAMAVIEKLGSTSTTVVRRLQLLGNPVSLSVFRLQQLTAAIAGSVVAGTLSTLGTWGFGLSTLALTALTIIIGALAGAAAWDTLLTYRSRWRQRRLNMQVPDASELVALAVSAGESIPGALQRVSMATSAELGGELAITVREIRAGAPTIAALASLSARNDSPALERFCLTVITAIERGTPISAVLQDQAADIRESSRRELMEEGGKREIAMLFPVVFLILPVTVLFALYPGLMALQFVP